MSGEENNFNENPPLHTEKNKTNIKTRREKMDIFPRNKYIYFDKFVPDKPNDGNNITENDGNNINNTGGRKNRRRTLKKRKTKSKRKTKTKTKTKSK